MATVEQTFLHGQLEERKNKLQAALAAAPQEQALHRLLHDVDAALERMAKGTYGLCEECHEPVEKDRLLADPLVCYCLDHLPPQQRRALEQDLELAARLQRGLLPPQDLRAGGWEVHYHYAPAGLVSGDYCDLIRPNGDLYFVLGDVSGKGVAASMLMSQLHAMFRSLTSAGLPLEQLVALANRLFCESALAGQYATLAFGRAGSNGTVEYCGAGHLPALLNRQGAVERVESSSVPLGMFCDGGHSFRSVALASGDFLLLYTDGLTEALDGAGNEYGIERLARVAGRRPFGAAAEVTAACLEDLRAFSSAASETDDLTVMVLRRM